MRFVILTQYFAPEVGAPQVRLAAVSNELRKHGHGVEVVTAMPHHLVGRVFPQYRGKLYMREMCDGVAVHRTWVYAATGLGVKRLINYMSFAVTCLLGLFSTKHSDYIFVESPPLFLSLPAALFSFVSRTPIIFNVADLWPDSIRALGIMKPGLAYRLAERLERWSYRRAKFVNAVTQHIGEVLEHSKGVASAKILFFPNGVDTEMFAPRPPDRALLDELNLAQKHIILYAGTHGAGQGLDVIIEAATLLADSDIGFLFVGDGHTKKKLQQLAASRRLTNVVFCDAQPVHEMPRYFSIATASIVPLIKRDLFQGARPSKICASIASGVPVIFSGEGEGAQLVAELGCGIVVPPERPAELAAAVRSISEDSRLRQQFALRGRQAATKDFGWTHIVERWLDELKSRALR